MTRIVATTLLCAACIIQCLRSEDAPPSEATGLRHASLEELVNAEVVSAGRKSQALSETSAAVYVITAEDIRRSGATTIPELLRRVPGLQVARVDSFTWAVSSRGFNGEFANKMQVMVDGRSVYNTMFGGVLWDTVNLPLEDISRIEVTRGPGGTMWGANATNGVIDIVTRPAAETQGSRASIGAGSTGEHLGYFSHGGALRNGHYRLSARTLRTGFLLNEDGEVARNGMAAGNLNFRLDTAFRDYELLVTAGGYGADLSQRLDIQFYQPPFWRPVRVHGDAAAGHVLARLTKAHGANGSSRLQFFSDHQKRNLEFWSPTMSTFDLEYQRRTRRGSHDIVAGGGARLWVSRMPSTLLGKRLADRKPTTLLNLFLQDEISLSENIQLTAGAKLEHNSYAGAQLQPTLRLRYQPWKSSAVWLAVSRAVRTPSRMEREIDSDAGIDILPGNIPIQYRVTADQSFGFEKLWAYELGVRHTVSAQLSIDTALFYHDYSDLSLLAPCAIQISPFGLLLPVRYTNGSLAESYGAEVSAIWLPRPDFRLHASYAHLRLDTRVAPSATRVTAVDLVEGRSPQHQGRLGFSLDLTRNLEWDTSLLAVTRLVSKSVPGYLRVDTRLAWTIRRGWEIAVIGQNLAGPRRQEFAAEGYTSDTLMRRSILLQLNRTF